MRLGILIKHKFIFYLFLLIVPLIIGTGFCFWSFTNSSDFIKNQKINLIVTEEESVGEFEIEVIPSFLIIEEGLDINSLTDGLFFYEYYYSEITSTTEIRRNPNLKVNFYEIPSIDTNYSLDLSFKLSFPIDSPLNEYITLIDEFTLPNLDYVNDGYISFSHFLTYKVNDELVSYTFSNGETHETIKHTLEIDLDKIIRFTDLDHKPNTIEKFNELREIVNSIDRESLHNNLILSLLAKKEKI